MKLLVQLLLNSNFVPELHACFVLGCPMHMKSAGSLDGNQNVSGPAHQERAYEYVECPVKSEMQEKLDPRNMVTFFFFPVHFL